MKFLNPSSKQFLKICQRRFQIKSRIRESVFKILEDVRKYQDKALVYYTKKFDKVKLSIKNLKVTESEISSAFQSIDTDFVRKLKEIIQRITNYYKAQLKNWNFKFKSSEGSKIEERKIPLESVGIYVPAGTAPLVSCVYMSAIPAQVAGVKNITLVSPPDKNGRINPYILVVASLLNIKKIYKVGGAQAIGALAFGTQSISPVDKIVGPGNYYVTEAKRQVFGFVDIDMLAGPSELVIMATNFTDFNFVVKDLKAQEEHFGGQVFLITNSLKLAKFVKNKVSSGYIIVVKNLLKACEFVNKIAPEHLQLMVKTPYRFLKFIKNAGAIFLGNNSPVAVGDYVAGPSHVLPTQGSARFFSGLGLHTFLKTIHIIDFSKKEVEKVQPLVEMIANLEGMKAHLESVNIRIGK